jgi:hypothetical protein
MGFEKGIAIVAAHTIDAEQMHMDWLDAKYPLQMERSSMTCRWKGKGKAISRERRKIQSIDLSL